MSTSPTDAPQTAPDAQAGQAAQARRRRTNRLLAAAVCGIQALVLLGWCAFYAVEIAQGRSDQVDRAIMSVALIVVFALGLGLLARGWRQPGVDWPRTPTVVWNALLLPVAWTMWTSHQPWLAVLVGVGAVVGITSAVSAGSQDDPELDEPRLEEPQLDEP